LQTKGISVHGHFASCKPAAGDKSLVEAKTCVCLLVEESRIMPYKKA
jgi:hypothetical protein